MTIRNHIFLLLSILLTFSSCGYAQKKDNIFFCGYSGNHQAHKLCNHLNNNFTSNQDAVNAIDRILKPLGLPSNFIIAPCENIKNAVAVTPSDGLRYILYDPEFITSIEQATNTDWSSLSILAHEIGHHLSGHTTSGAENLKHQRELELEADEFSGYVLKKLGASLPQAQSAIILLSNENDDKYSTHPRKSRRLAAIEKGWNKSTSGSDSKTSLSSYKQFSNDINGAIKWVDELDYYYSGNKGIQQIDVYTSKSSDNNSRLNNIEDHEIFEYDTNGLLKSYSFKATYPKQNNEIETGGQQYIIQTLGENSFLITSDRETIQIKFEEDRVLSYEKKHTDTYNDGSKYISETKADFMYDKLGRLIKMQSSDDGIENFERTNINRKEVIITYDTDSYTFKEIDQSRLNNMRRETYKICNNIKEGDISKSICYSENKRTDDLNEDEHNISNTEYELDRFGNTISFTPLIKENNKLIRGEKKYRDERYDDRGNLVLDDRGILYSKRYIIKYR